MFDLLNLFLTDFLTPYGLPQEVHTSLPDNARSALRLELPQNKHLFKIITIIQFKKSSKNDKGELILLE